MMPRTEWEALVADAVAELAGGATTVALYGPAHPRAGQSVARLHALLERLLGSEPELALVLLGEELFVQGRPFTRRSRQAPAVIRRFRRRGLEHATFRAGVTAAELKEFLVELAAADDAPVTARPHIQIGRIELDERGLGGPDSRDGRQGRRKLPTVRDRIELLAEVFAAFAAGAGLPVGDLEAVVHSLLDGLDRDPDPLRQLAPWQGEARWPAVHAHNVAAVAVGLARLGRVGHAACVDLGLAGLLHDVAKLFLPAEVTERELELSGSELELILDHPRTGLEALLATAQLPPLVLVVVAEHHLGYNSSGYPRLLRPRRPHPASRVVSLADTFDMLHTARGSHGLATRETTVAWLSAHAGTVLDPGPTGALLDLLARQEG